MATAAPTGILPGELDLSILPPQFTQILADTVGNLGSDADGFSLHFNAMVDGFGVIQDVIAGGDTDLDAATQATPAFSEPFITDDQQAVADAHAAGTADLATFDSSFPNAPQPPTPPGGGGGGSTACGPPPDAAPPPGKTYCCINGVWTTVDLGTECNNRPPGGGGGGGGGGGERGGGQGGGGGGGGGGSLGGCGDILEDICMSLQ